MIPVRRLAIALLPALALAFTLAAAASAAPVAERAEDVRPLGVGETLPAVAVRDIDGAPADLLAVVTEQPTVLIVYRGGWCPYCSKHLGKLAAAERELVDLGYQIVGLSPDRPEKLREGLAQLREKLGDEVRYRLLSDSTMDAAKALGLAFRVDEAYRQKLLGYGMDIEEASGESHHLLPVPAAFVVAPSGEIRFRFFDPDYTVRVDADALLAAARAEAGAASAGGH